MSFRQMDGAKIECKANNTLVSNPTIRSLDLEMYRKYSILKYLRNKSFTVNVYVGSISKATEGGCQDDWKYGGTTKIQSQMHRFWFQTTSCHPMVYERRKTRLGGVSYRKNLGDRERVSKKIHTYYILVYFPHIILPFFPLYLSTSFSRSHMHSSDDTTILIRKYLHGKLLRPLVSSITLPSPSIMDWIWPARPIIQGSSGMLSKIPLGLIYTVSRRLSLLF